MVDTVPDRVDALLTDLAAVVDTLPVSALLTGSVAAGAFSTHLSDIDVVLAASEFEDGSLETIREAVTPLRERPFGDRLDVILVDAGELSGDCLHGQRLDGSPVTLHELDVLILRDRSHLLAGRDIRGALPNFRAEDVIDGIIDHVITNMLPPVLATCPTTDVEFLEDIVMPYTFVMGRCLYTLETGAVTSKPATTDWLAASAREHPARAPLAGLIRTFDEWYTDGMPDRPATAELTRRFSPATASFLSTVASNRGASIPLETLRTASDMIAVYERKI